MAIHLTPEREQRIQAMVDAGAYPAVGQALDAVAKPRATMSGVTGGLFLRHRSSRPFRDCLSSELTQNRQAQASGC